MAKVGDFTTLVPTRFQTDAQTESINSSNSVTTKTNGKTADDSKIIDRVPVSTKGKPPETDPNEWLFREALKQVAPKYGLNSSDIELEVKSRQNTLTDADPSNDHNFLQKPYDKNAREIKTTLGIHESTIQKMQERKQVLQVIAEKEAFGGKLSDADIFALAELGYSRQDIADMRNIKMMEYGGFQSNFEQRAKDQFQNLNNELRQKMVSEELEKLNQRPDSDFYVEGNEKINPDFERRRIANQIVNDKLAGKTPFEYLQNQKNEEALEKRFADKSFTDYLSNGSKNLLNSFYGGIGSLIKGLAGVAVNNTIYFDKDGKEVRPNVSDTLGYKIGDWVSQNVQAPNVDPDFDKTVSAGTLPKTVGGFLPAVLGAWVTKNPQATVAVYSGLSTGGAVYDEAKAKGATEEQAQKTALLTGGFIGLTSTLGFGKTLEALNRGAGAATWKSIFSEAIKDGGRNAMVAGGQTIGENAIAKNIYDKKRGYMDNVEERMIAAGITGTALRGGLDIINKIRAGRNPQTLIETQKALRVTPQSELNPNGIELRNSGFSLNRKLNRKIIEEANNVGEKPPIARNWESVRGLIGKKPGEVTLPKDYFISKRHGVEAIIRKIDDDTKFAPLSLDKEGRIQVGGADNRISNAYRMDVNYQTGLRTKYETILGSKLLADARVKAIKKLITIHHILPDNVLQKSELGTRAIAAGYNLDEAGNLIGLANKAVNKPELVKLGEATQNQPGHWSSHGKYDARVTERLNQVKRELEIENGKPLNEIPDKIILEKMKEIENEFRQKIQNGEVDTKDGRIAMNRLNFERGEIRV